MNKLIICIALLAALTAAALLGCAKAPANTADNAAEKAADAEPAADGGNASASYSDSVMSFSDLDEKAGFIAQAEVESSEVIVGQISTLKVNRVYRGEVPESIRLFQMADDNAVAKGCEYLLFMNPQLEGEPGDYYPVGGGIGAIKLDSENRIMYLAYGVIADDDFYAWRSENGFGDWSVKYAG